MRPKHTRMQTHAAISIAFARACAACGAQDLFLFRNYFALLTLSGRKGFYVDSGANDARHLSNTFFFDKCLGWEGLCIEPMEQYHKELRKCAAEAKQ